METGTLSYELLLRYLTLCVSGGHDEEVFDVYDIMRESFPSLDTGATTLFIKSFSRTDRWKEAMNLLDEIKKVYNYLLPHREIHVWFSFFVVLIFCPSYQLQP